MKAAVLYASTHGKTRQIVARAIERLHIASHVYDVKNLGRGGDFGEYDLLMFFCPTYGDEELQVDMEEFLLAFNLNLSNKLFVVCELGNYYGYDDFRFGAMPIIRQHLLRLNAAELCSPLSLDAFPRTNWRHLDRWVELVNRGIETHD